MSEVPESDESVQGATWSRERPTPEPVQVSLVHTAPEGARLRDLEEGQRTHKARLDEHDNVLASIDRRLGELIVRVDKFSTRLLIGVAILFGGTENGGALARELASLLR